MDSNASEASAVCTDFTDQEIKVGMHLAYPVRRGSRMWLTRITVTQVSLDEIKGFNSIGRRVTVKNIKNCVIVQR